ncbi:MAG: ferritin-like domain-containing protein [Acidobacteria bacterium]|nr:MAG: ferritin-like domain-containing protein [Acidobacteriota bacterium]
MTETMSLPDKDAVFQMFFADLPTHGTARDVVKRLEERIEGILKENIGRHFQPLDTLEKQLEMCYFNAWGELRSVDTFAQQIKALGTRHVDLKRGLCRQIHEEIEHFKYYRQCALQMGGQDMMNLPPPEVSLKMFDYCDSFADPLESVITCQFCTEKGAVFWFRAALESSEALHPDFKATIEKIMPDEYFHVSNGRRAALIYAEQKDKRDRLIRLCSDAVWITMNNIAGGSAIVV